jgi:formate hydrogenlyase subunit 6/NADH:ubiquinone oxidoreductase subunit I
MLNFLVQIMKNLIAKPACAEKILEARDFYQPEQGKLEIVLKNCDFCGLCAQQCPSLALEVITASQTWIHHPFRCVNCGACVEACPFKALSRNGAYRLAAYTQEDETHTRQQLSG